VGEPGGAVHRLHAPGVLVVCPGVRAVCSGRQMAAVRGAQGAVLLRVHPRWVRAPPPLGVLRVLCREGRRGGVAAAAALNGAGGAHIILTHSDISL